MSHKPLFQSKRFASLFLFLIFSSILISCTPNPTVRTITPTITLRATQINTQTFTPIPSPTNTVTPAPTSTLTPTDVPTITSTLQIPSLPEYGPESYKLREWTLDERLADIAIAENLFDTAEAEQYFDLPDYLIMMLTETISRFPNANEIHMLK